MTRRELAEKLIPFRANDRVRVLTGYYGGARGTVRGFTRDATMVRVQLDGRKSVFQFNPDTLQRLDGVAP